MRSTPPVRSAGTDDSSRPEDFLIRPAIPSDIEDFYELASLAGAGFTSLPANEALLAERLRTSEQAFVGETGTLMLALEDRRRRRVVGCAAVKPKGTPRHDFLNFRIADGGRALEPTDRCAGMTEVGSLLLHPDYRSNGIGPFLARSRYLLIASDVARFGDEIFSELRGVVDEDDRSPFYDSVCARYFGCSFAEADDLCAHGRQNELNALLPDAPIALDTLSGDALAAIGRPHAAGRRALDYLEEEGFVFGGVVDLLDGGPLVIGRTTSIRTIRATLRRSIGSLPMDAFLPGEAYVAVGHGPHFRCCRTDAGTHDAEFYHSMRTGPAHQAEDGLIAHICPTESGRRNGVAQSSGRSSFGERASKSARPAVVRAHCQARPRS